MSWLSKRHQQRAPSPPRFGDNYSHGGVTGDNKTLFQTFEWHTPSQPPAPHETHSANSHYSRLIRLLPSLAQIGTTTIWLPPGCKANQPQGNGYDCYDLWDLGEFDQKWTRSTKWGSREELADLIETAKRVGVECIWDAVLNHKTAGDATEEAWAVEVDKQDRRIEICPPKKIEAWLKYDFPGREREGMKYSPLKWRAEHSNGTDWDQRAQKNAIYKLIDDPATYPKPHQQPTPLWRNGGMNRFARFAGKMKSELLGEIPRRPGKGWADDVDDMFGNFDYLMFSNIDYAHPAVRADVLRWGEWMIQDVGIDGFRLDAAQHFSFNFSREWVSRVQQASSRRRAGREAFVVGEVWSGEVQRIIRWLDAVGQNAYAYDAPLFYNFSRISEDVRSGSKNSDLRTILRDSLLQLVPGQAVTLVSNHDTQTGQSSYQPIEPRMKTLFYAFILLRQEGYPCVFWGDLYGIRGPKGEPPACRVSSLHGGLRSLLPDMILARKFFAYGEQSDHFDEMDCIGWTRSGTRDRPGSGCAVVLSIRPEAESIGKTGWGTKKMGVGRPGETWVNIMAEEEARAEVVIDEKGNGVFPCQDMSIAVFVRKNAQYVERFPVKFNVDAYAQ